MYLLLPTIDPSGKRLTLFAARYFSNSASASSMFRFFSQSKGTPIPRGREGIKWRVGFGGNRLCGWQLSTTSLFLRLIVYICILDLEIWFIFLLLVYVFF